MPAEVEAKFRADSEDVLEALAEMPSLAFAELGPPVTTAEVDHYLDTADGRLASAGWACRLRARGSSVRVSLKGPADATSGAWYHSRPELEGPATEVPDPRGWPPSEAVARLAELSGGERLVERLTLHQRRTERSVVVDGAPVATLSLDVVEVADAPPDTEPLRVVELELAGEDALDRARFDLLAESLLARGGLVADAATKLEHALEQLTTR